MNARLIAILVAGVVSVGVVMAMSRAPAPQTADQTATLGQRMQDAVINAKSIPKVQALLNEGANINYPIGCGNFGVLNGAILTRDVDMLKFLLAHGAKLHGGELAAASFIPDTNVALDMAKIFLSAGANVNATNQLGPPIVLAAYQKNQDLVALLLAQPGVNVNATDVEGNTALIEAVKGPREIVDMLAKAGANPKLANRWGRNRYESGQ